MRLLNDLLNLHDGFDDEGWMKECKKRMVNTFPREDPFSILVPAGFDIDKVISGMRNYMDFDIIFLKCFDRTMTYLPDAIIQMIYLWLSFMLFAHTCY